MKQRNKIIILALLLSSIVLMSFSAVSATDTNNITQNNDNNNVNIQIEPSNQVSSINETTDTNSISQGVSLQSTNDNVANLRDNDTNKSVNILVEDFNQTYGTPKNLTINLTNVTTGHALIGQHISLNLTRLSDGKSKIYWTTTDLNGQAFLNIELSPGSYSVLASFGDGTDFKNFTINKINTDLIQYNFEVNRKGEKYRTILRDENNNPLTNQVIYFTLSNGKNSKTYNATTDANGAARYYINLNTGNYTVTCTYMGNNTVAGCSATNNITIYPNTTKMPTTVAGRNAVNGTITINTKGDYVIVELRENNGLLLPYHYVNITLSQGNKSKVYNLTTNASGLAKIAINLQKGIYNLSYVFGGSTYFLGCTGNNTLIVNTTD